MKDHKVERQPEDSSLAQSPMQVRVQLYRAALDELAEQNGKDSIRDRTISRK